MDRKPNVERLVRDSGMLRHLGIEFSDLSPERVVATMPVDERHLQPPGFLHGGMSVALAESVAVAGAWLNCPSGKVALGSSINASYIRSKRVGSRLWAVGIPEFVGPDKQLWEVDVRDEAGNRVCAFRCTLSVVDVDGELPP
jgi:1,4-dihydroxy-2-naphthoyl-CoA hydrolase